MEKYNARDLIKTKVAIRNEQPRDTGKFRSSLTSCNTKARRLRSQIRLKVVGARPSSMMLTQS